MNPGTTRVSWEIDIEDSDIDEYLMMNNMNSCPTTRHYAAARLAYDSMVHTVAECEFTGPHNELALVFSINDNDIDLADPAPHC